MKKQQKGFTLIELVLVIIVLGVLAAVAVPKFVDLSGDAETGAAAVSAKELESIYGIASLRDTAGTPHLPSVDFIATFVSPSTPPTVAATGLSIVNGKKTITMNTFTDTGCATATTASTDEVACVTTTITP